MLCHITPPDRSLIWQYVKWILKEIAWQRAASHVFYILTAKILLPIIVFITYGEEKKPMHFLTKGFIKNKAGYQQPHMSLNRFQVSDHKNDRIILISNFRMKKAIHFFLFSAQLSQQNSNNFNTFHAEGPA